MNDSSRLARLICVPRSTCLAGLICLTGCIAACTYDFERFVAKGPNTSGGGGGGAATLADANRGPAAAGENGSAGEAPSWEAAGGGPPRDAGNGQSGATAGRAGATGGTAVAGGGTSFDCDAVRGTVFQGHCYFANSTPAAYDASGACAPAHLVTITSSSEESAVELLLAGRDHWIGLKNSSTIHTEASFQWVTSEAFNPSTSFRHWAASEPDFSGDCVRMRADGYWADYPCTSELNSICEHE